MPEDTKDIIKEVKPGSLPQGKREPSEEPKKRGPKPGSKRIKEDKDITPELSEEQVGDLLSGIFSALGDRLGPQWPLKEGEKKLLAHSTYNVLLKYSDKIGDSLTIGTFIAVSAVIILPRIKRREE